MRAPIPSEKTLLHSNGNPNITSQYRKIFTLLYQVLEPPGPTKHCATGATVARRAALAPCHQLRAGAGAKILAARPLSPPLAHYTLTPADTPNSPYTLTPADTPRG